MKSLRHEKDKKKTTKKKQIEDKIIKDIRHL